MNTLYLSFFLHADSDWFVTSLIDFGENQTKTKFLLIPNKSAMNPFPKGFFKAILKFCTTKQLFLKIINDAAKGCYQSISAYVLVLRKTTDMFWDVPYR